MIGDTINASTFKAQCLALMDEIARTGRTLVVTKRGRPLVQIGPVEDPPGLHGSVRFRADEDELLAPVGGAWHATRG